MSLDALWPFLYQTLSEPLQAAAAVSILFGIGWVLISALSRVTNNE